MLTRTFKRPEFLHKLLLGYWVTTSLILFSYLFLRAAEQGKELSILLKTFPELPLGVLMAGINVLLAAGLWRIAPSERPLYLSLALIQQAVSLNFLGVLLIYFYQRQANYRFWQRPTKEQPGLFISFGVLLLLTLLVLLLRLRLLLA